MAKTTGGEIIAKMLREEGVDTVFGIIDGTYVRFLSACSSEGIKLYTPRHESIAAHMAGAYARLTGKLGVFIASNGPGVANVLPGVAVENAEGNRVLLITSSRRTGITYPDRGGAFQCFDQVGVIGAMSKWSATAASFERIPELLRQAFRKCYSGRPGVVHLDVPEDLFNGKCPPMPIWKPASYRRLEPIAPNAEQVRSAAAMLVRAELPLIHAGSGVIHAGAYDELRQLAELLHAPVTTSWSARGVLAETSELSWPMLHIKAVNEVRNAADVVLCLGSEVGETDWWGKPPYWAPAEQQSWIQVDIDDDKLGRNRPVDLAILADVKVFCRRLIEELSGGSGRTLLEERKRKVGELHKSIEKDRAKLDKKLENRSSPMVTAHVPVACRQVFDDDCVAVFDGGNTTVWGHFFYKLTRPNTQLATHHMGHLGAGVGQALGAAVANPDRPVCCIIGDGAMGFNLQEIETAVRHGLKVVFVVCCDKQWGMVKMTMSFAFKPVKTIIKKSLSPDELINTELNEIRFDQVGRAMGAHGERVSDPEQLQHALRRCLAKNMCCVVHVDVDPTKHMWAPGLMHFKAMHQEPKG